MYVYGHEVESFHPCGDTTTFWFIAPTRQSSWLHAQHDSLTTKPYQPIYIEAFGRAAEKATEGFAADYTALWRSDSVVRIRAAQATDCRMSEFH